MNELTDLGFEVATVMQGALNGMPLAIQQRIAHDLEHGAELELRVRTGLVVRAQLWIVSETGAEAVRLGDLEG